MHINNARISSFSAFTKAQFFIAFPIIIFCVLVLFLTKSQPSYFTAISRSKKTNFKIGNLFILFLFQDDTQYPLFD